MALVHSLVGMGANVNAMDENGKNPIFIACFNRRKEVALELAALGADPNIKNREVSKTAVPSVRKYGD